MTPYGADDLGVSRRHARLLRDQKAVYLTDLNSTNGTRLNGESLPSSVENACAMATKSLWVSSSCMSTSRSSWVMLWAGLLALLLAACGTGGAQIDDPLILVATPVPPDANFVGYTHPSGVFSLRLPPDWIAGDLPDPNGVRVQFTSIEDSQAVTRLSVYVVNTGQPMTAEAFAQATNAYQPPEDVAGYAWTEIERAAQRDGSRRITGVRTYPVLGPRSLNIFLQGDGAFFSALEADVTDIDAVAWTGWPQW